MLSSEWFPERFTDWPPILQVLALILLSFGSEDLTTLGAAFLASIHQISLPVALTGCLLGIWIGDAGIYLMARFLGPKVLTLRLLKRRLSEARLVQSQAWFQTHGAWILLITRFLPGTRVPTFITAGLLRVPFSFFLFWTGLAVSLWISGCFVGFHFWGPSISHYLERLGIGAWGAVVLFLVIYLILGQVIRQCRNFMNWNTAMSKWRHWEFWPAWLFYFPVACYYLLLALRYRSFTVPTAANPSMFTGGLIGESKFEILETLRKTSPEHTATAYLIQGSTTAERLAYLNDLVKREKLSLPMILKPDVGQRGAGVKRIHTWEDARCYLRQCPVPLILQNFVPGPYEIGVFYYRYPNEKTGHIFAITQKIFPTLQGDGIHTIAQLIENDPRARFQAPLYLARWKGHETEVPLRGRSLPLGHTGNHAQGCIFKDGMHLLTPALKDAIEAISQRYPDFYFGRFDIRYASEEALAQGHSFQILELNGVAAEATSIYDSKNSLFKAYQVLFRQWKIAFHIGSINRKNGHATTPLNLVWKTWRDFNQKAHQLPLSD